MNSKSAYKGVSWSIRQKLWVAKTGSTHNRVIIGLFNTEIEAAIAYNWAVFQDSFAYLNPIENWQTITIFPCQKTCSSKHRGVFYQNKEKRIKKWVAKFKLNKKEYYLGAFNTEIEAALAYNKKAIEMLGDKAKLNIIE